MSRALLLWLVWASACPIDRDDATETGALERKMVRELNVEREARGLRPLGVVPPLAAAARQHSRNMVDLGCLSHKAGGQTMRERIKRAVPDACRFGENVTKHTSIDIALSDLMGSPAHRENLLDPDYTGIGIGIERAEDGLLYVTQEFVAFCPEEDPSRS